jgi:CRP-like cAMP-binding protein
MVGTMARKGGLQYQSSRGRTVITGLWSAGDLIGALNLGACSEVHQMTVRCLESSLLHTLSIDQFYALVRSYPEFGETVVRALSVRLHWFNHLTLELGTQPAFERICGMLLALSEHFAVRTADGLLIDLNLTHATLAAMVGVGRPFLTMTLRQLEQRGHLRSVRRRIVIRDAAALNALAFEVKALRRRQERTAGARGGRRDAHAPRCPSATLREEIACTIRTLRSIAIGGPEGIVEMNAIIEDRCGRGAAAAAHYEPGSWMDPGQISRPLKARSRRCRLRQYCLYRRGTALGGSRFPLGASKGRRSTITSPGALGFIDA